MTGEQFHDALTLLPEDLIARADAVRTQKRKVIHWQRYASLAACLAVLIACGVLYRSNSQTKVLRSESVAAPMVANQAPAMGTARDSFDMESARVLPDFLCVEAPGLSDMTVDYAFPEVTLAESREALNGYLSEISNFSQTDALTATCADFDEGFFDARDLLLILAEDITGKCEISDILWENGGCTVKISVLPGEEITNYCALIPASKGEIQPEKVTVIYISDTNP